MHSAFVHKNISGIYGVGRLSGGVHKYFAKIIHVCVSVYVECVATHLITRIYFYLLSVL